LHRGEHLADLARKPLHAIADLLDDEGIMAMRAKEDRSGLRHDVRNISRPDGRKLAAMKFAPSGERSSRLVSINFALGIRKSFY
jgi:hypothetical protein